MQDIRPAACIAMFTLSLAELLEEKMGQLPAMLRKCANPACTVPFRSLREGKLFLAETTLHDPDTVADGQRKKPPRREHFWLCQSCCAHFTLRFDIDQGMMTVPLQRDAGPRWVPALA